MFILELPFPTRADAEHFLAANNLVLPTGARLVRVEELERSARLKVAHAGKAVETAAMKPNFEIR